MSLMFVATDYGPGEYADSEQWAEYYQAQGCYFLGCRLFELVSELASASKPHAAPKTLLQSAMAALWGQLLPPDVDDVRNQAQRLLPHPQAEQAYGLLLAIRHRLIGDGGSPAAYEAHGAELERLAGRLMTVLASAQARWRVEAESAGWQEIPDVEQPKRRRRAQHQELGTEAKALQLLTNNPEWSVRQIADTLGENESTLRGFKRFMEIVKARQSMPPPRGFRTAGGGVEAYDDEN
jgi:hypothetical protein